MLHKTIWSPTLVCVPPLPGVGQIHDSGWANESDIIIPETASCPDLIYSSDLQWQGALGDTLWLWVTPGQWHRKVKGWDWSVISITPTGYWASLYLHLLSLLKLTEMDKHCDIAALDSPERDANEIPLLAKLQTQSKHSPLTPNLFLRIITRNRELKTGGTGQKIFYSSV